MRVLLVNPFSVVQKSWMPYPPHEPLGLEYLAAVASNDHEVGFLDCRASFLDRFELLPNGLFHVGASLEQVKAFITDWKPELVGVTLPFATQIQPVHSIVNAVKEVDKGIVTVVGGCAASCYPEQMLRENCNLDVIVVGEGEVTFKMLLSGKEMDTIDGLVYREDNKQIVQNVPRRFIENLDTILFPRRDLVPLENYSNFRFGTGRLKRARSLLRTRGSHYLVKRVLSKTFGGNDFRQRIPKYGLEAKLLTSRGCPFDCYFCAVHNVWSRTYRMRSAKNVLEEMELLYEKYKVRHFGIVDDNFNISKKRTIEICKGIVEHGLDVTLRADSGVYLGSLDEDVLTWMKKAGFHELYFAVESGNQRILKEVIGKNIDLGQAKTVATLCEGLGIVSGGFFMVGVPGETKETMNDTVDFAVSSGLDRVRLYTCQPFPGSRMFEDCRRNGWLTGDFDVSKTLVFESKSYVQTKDFCPEDVEQINRKGKALLRKQGRLDMDE